MSIYDRGFSGGCTCCSIRGFTEKTAKVEIAAFSIHWQSAQYDRLRTCLWTSDDVESGLTKPFEFQDTFTAQCETKRMRMSFSETEVTGKLVDLHSVTLWLEEDLCSVNQQPFHCGSAVKWVWRHLWITSNFKTLNSEIPTYQLTAAGALEEARRSIALNEHAGCGYCTFCGCVTLRVPHVLCVSISVLSLWHWRCSACAVVSPTSE